MNLEQEILINQYGQNLISIEVLLENYKISDIENKRIYLHHLVTLIIQSKCMNSDISQAISNSNLKKTFTPCVLLEGGEVKYYNLKKIISLPDYELDKTLVLLLHLFKIGYNRRFQQERNNPNKWWYWDLSDDKNVKKILSYSSTLIEDRSE